MALEASIRGHSKLFSTMVELIPAQYYVFNEEDFVQSTKYFHNKKGPTARPSPASKDSIIKAKKARLDPSGFKTVQELKEESVRAAEEGPESTVEENDGLVKMDLEKIESIPLLELKERLRSKIEEYKTKRKAPCVEGKRETEKSSKRKKIDNKEKRNKAKQMKTIIKKVDGTLNNVEKENSILFNKFDFGEGKKKKKENLKQLLAKAESDQKRIEEISQADEERGKELTEKMKWRKVLDKAQGKERKDDASLLKKTLKKRESKKKVSSRKWREREANQEQLKEKRQEKRECHIQERIDAKKSKLSGKRKQVKGKKKIVIRS